MASVTAPTTKSRGHLWICNQCIAAPMQLFNNNTIESLPLLRYLLLHCMEVEQYKCYYNGIHPTTEVVGFLPVRIVNEMWEIKHLSISSPVVEFEMDYFGRKEAVAHLADGHKIHLFHNAELHCDVVEIFHGETLLQTTVIPRPETRYKKIRFLAGKIRVLFLRKIPEDEWTNRLIPYEAVIPHDVGKIATVKPYVRNFRK